MGHPAAVVAPVTAPPRSAWHLMTRARMGRRPQAALMRLTSTLGTDTRQAPPWNPHGPAPATPRRAPL
eukprot:3253616-Lingulodinium_polyedra.AAC.1